MLKAENYTMMGPIRFGRRTSTGVIRKAVILRDSTAGRKGSSLSLLLPVFSQSNARFSHGTICLS